MTKAEERKILDKIENLIQSAGEDSYIALTFSGIVELANYNIENDFGNSPVRDLEEARKKAAEVAKDSLEIIRERDRLKADFDELAAAYREAVGVCRAASFYIHKEKNRLLTVIDELPEDADDGQIGAAVRAHKQAKEAMRRCSAVLDASQRKPLCFAMRED